MPDKLSSRQLRVGVIGFGRIATVHAQAWRECPGVQLEGVCDGDAAACRRAAEEGLSVFASVEEMLDAVTPDAVSVCTPPSTHLDLARVCLARGLHVLCEKPLTSDLSSALALLESAVRAQGQLVVASKFRQVPEIARARELVRGGELGRVKEFRIEFAAAVAMADRWNSNPAVSGGGVIIDNGWHAFDVIQFLFGGIDSVETRLGESRQGLAVEDSAEIRVTTTSGVTGQVVLSWSAPSSSDDYVTIVGEHRTIRVGWKSYDKVGAHARMMAGFRDVVLAAAQPSISLDETLGIAATVDAAYQSSRTGKMQMVMRSAMATGAS